MMDKPLSQVEIEAIREKFKHCPSLEELLATGDYTEPVTMEEFERQERLHDPYNF